MQLQHQGLVQLPPGSERKIAFALALRLVIAAHVHVRARQLVDTLEAKGIYRFGMTE